MTRSSRCPRTAHRRMRRAALRRNDDRKPEPQTGRHVRTSQVRRGGLHGTVQGDGVLCLLAICANRAQRATARITVDERREPSSRASGPQPRWPPSAASRRPRRRSERSPRRVQERAQQALVDLWLRPSNAFATITRGSSSTRYQRSGAVGRPCAASSTAVWAAAIRGRETRERTLRTRTSDLSSVRLASQARTRSQSSRSIAWA